MATVNPPGRANYEPNSWGADVGRPREDPAGFVSTPTVETGPKRRLRADSFADHYSQARQFLSVKPPSNACTSLTLSCSS